MSGQRSDDDQIATLVAEISTLQLEAARRRAALKQAFDQRKFAKQIDADLRSDLDDIREPEDAARLKLLRLFELVDQLPEDRREAFWSEYLRRNPSKLASEEQELWRWMEIDISRFSKSAEMFLSELGRWGTEHLLQLERDKADIRIATRSLRASLQAAPPEARGPIARAIHNLLLSYSRASRYSASCVSSHLRLAGKLRGLNAAGGASSKAAEKHARVKVAILATCKVGDLRSGDKFALSIRPAVLKYLGVKGDSYPSARVIAKLIGSILSDKTNGLSDNPMDCADD